MPGSPTHTAYRDLTRAICIYYRWPHLVIRMGHGASYNWPDVRLILLDVLNWVLDTLPDPLDESISEWLESHGWNCDTGWPPQGSAQTLREAVVEFLAPIGTILDMDYLGRQFLAAQAANTARGIDIQRRVQRIVNDILNGPPTTGTTAQTPPQDQTRRPFY